MTDEFDSFNGGAFDAFIQSALGNARGGGDLWCMAGFLVNQTTFEALDRNATYDGDNWVDGGMELTTPASTEAGSLSGTHRMRVFRGDLWTFGWSSSGFGDYVARWSGTEFKEPEGFDDFAMMGEVMSGDLYCIGGNSGDATKPVWLWDPATETWSNFGGVPTTVGGLDYDERSRALTGNGGTLYFAGDLNDDIVTPRPRNGIWSVASGGFTNITPTSAPYAGLTNGLFSFQGDLYYFGGPWDDGLSSPVTGYGPIWKYDGSWSQVGDNSEFTVNGSGIVTSSCQRLGVFNGQLCATCFPTFSGGSRLATWDGASWNELGANSDDVKAPTLDMLDLGGGRLLCFSLASGLTHVWNSDDADFEASAFGGGLSGGSSTRGGNFVTFP